MEHRTKASAVADELRRMIELGELPPGAVLRQRAIAERLQVSPTPVREALSRLQAEGFVITVPHRGATVVGEEVSRLWENALIRASLEGLGARMAAERIGEPSLSELHRLAAAFEGAAPGPDTTAANRAFHFHIYEAARSPVLLRLLNILWNILPRGPETYRAHEDSARQHEQIVAALRRGDGDTAEALTRVHILESANAMKLAAAASTPEVTPA